MAVRIDKYLWAIRLFKTRTMATKACDSGKVKMDDAPVKASRKVEKSDVINVRVNYTWRTIKVVDPIEKRVGAPIAVTCYEDLTDPSILSPKPFTSAFYQVGKREPGTGRPTKKERREIDGWRDAMDDLPED